MLQQWQTEKIGSGEDEAPTVEKLLRRRNSRWPSDILHIYIVLSIHPSIQPERHGEVARVSIVRHPSQSDLPERRSEVARVSMARRHKMKPGATSQSDPLRSLPKSGATHQGRSRPLVQRHQNRASWSDPSERPTKVAPSQSDQHKSLAF
uniref:Uncharacterized protein n=1 Tax=Brassica oleracea var. oleracea TaxID=109376 RepID=A0A0D3D9A6_BRAOL